MDSDISCPLCGLADETIDHLLVNYPLTWKLRNFFMDLLRVAWAFSSSLDNLLGSWSLAHCNRRRKLAWITISVVVMWTIWKEINARIFESKAKEIKDICQTAK